MTQNSADDNGNEVASGTVVSGAVPNRRRLFRRLLALAGIGITGALLSQDKVGLLSPVQAANGDTITVGNSFSGTATTELDSSTTTAGGVFFAKNTGSTAQGIVGSTENVVAPTAAKVGVHGVANSGYGVQGESNNVGVYGDSITGVGVRGFSSNVGVHGISGLTGVALVAQCSTSSGTGNLQEWRIVNTPVSKVNASGALIAPQVGQSSPNFNYAAPGNPPTFTNSVAAGYLADGLAIPFTPNLSGNVLIFASVDLYNNAGAYTFGQIWYGTGTAPAFGATLPSGAFAVSPGRGNINASGTLFAIKTGLTIGTAYWFDLGHGINGGTGTHANIAYIIIEI